MKVKMILHNHPHIASTVDSPTIENVESSVAKLGENGVDTLEIVSEGNRMFLARSQEMWLVKYTGNHLNDFVNAILTDPNQPSEDEVIFTMGGQRVDYVLSETVNQEVATIVAAHFAQNGRLYESSDLKWVFIDRLPLAD